MSAIAMATMGKFEYVVDVGGGSGLGIGDDKKKPQIVITQVIEEKEAKFEIYGIEEEII